MSVFKVDDKDIRFSTAAIDHVDPDEIIEGRNIDLYYGKIEIFQERTKYISFCRPFTEHQIKYVIRRDPLRKLVKESFEPERWSGVLMPNENFNLPITYKPTLASLKDVEIFEYVDSDYEIIKITVTGHALGPHCTSSSKKIVFYKTSYFNMLQGQVEITNDSLATAYFKIDYPKADIFKITPMAGTIKPGGYQLITVKFCPHTHGFFARKMFCLIWNSDPLVFDLLGYYGNEYRDIEEGLKYYTVPLGQSYGFGAYLRDCLTTKNDVLPFVLNANNFDFGCCQLKVKGPTNVTSVTNYMRRKILVEWEKGTNIFKITPEKTYINPIETAQFEIEFDPDENYNTYSETLVAQIDWKSEKMSALEEARPTTPFMCTLRVQGHSFPENEGWITHIEVLPEVVYFQPCLPGEKVYTTFMLRNNSHLPVMYKLVPPKTTRIIAKPMIGRFRSFDIIAVQLQTEKPKIKIYIEEWKIIINGRKEKQMTVYFHGETSIPTIVIGTKNRINGGNIQEGSQKTVKVNMKNTSYFTISYRFRQRERSILSIEPKEGILPGNEQTKLEIVITGQQCAPKAERFMCQINIIERNGATSGEMYETPVELFSDCSYSQLSACPSYENFGRQPLGKKISFEFEGVNFGDSPIFFQACQCGEDIHDTNFRIRPCFGEVQPRDCKQFAISGIISLFGEQTLYFGYYNRVSRDSPMVTGEPTVFFTLTYCAEFPTIQVKEIVQHDFGPLFGKPDLFTEYLCISKLNGVLKEIISDETKEIHIRLPEFEIQDKIFTIVLAITNVTPYETTVTLKRKKICKCELVEKPTIGFSQRKKDYDCPHRDSLNMELSDTKLLSHGVSFLTIKVKYCIPKTTKMCYVMHISNHRAVEIYFQIYGIPPKVPRLSLYKEHFIMDLQDVFIGTRVASTQMFWMYNNTSNLLNIEFDTTEIKHLCKKEGFKVLEIVNWKDQILPYSQKALLVKFLPIELRKYEVQLDVTYQNPEETPYLMKFEIRGRGNMATGRGFITEETPPVSKFYGHSPISLSIEAINLNTLPVWNRRKILIYIKSNARNKIIEYIWGSVKIENVIEISAETEYGLLRPREVHPVLLVIKSFSDPCSASFILPCQFINYTDSVLNKITKAKHKEAQDKIDIELSLMKPKKKTEIPSNPITIHPEPPTLCTTLILNITTVHSKDLDLHMDPHIQLKQYPNQSMENIEKNLLKHYYPEERRKSLNYPEKGSICLAMDVQERLFHCRILEEVIGDVLHSEIFKKNLEIHYNSPRHYYTEFVMDDQEIMSKKIEKRPLSNEDIANFRKREIEKFFAFPKITELSNILQRLIYDSISKIVQCNETEYNINEIHEQIESSLYNCRKKNCPCNKSEVI